MFRKMKNGTKTVFKNTSQALRCFEIQVGLHSRNVDSDEFLLWAKRLF